MAGPTFGVSPDTTMVLYNADSAEGVAIANHYAQTHPGVRLFPLSLGTVGEEVSGEYYLDNIRAPVLGELQQQPWGDSIDHIVTTKGLPLRIDVGQEPGGTGSVSNRWRRYSSLESELTRIDTIDNTLAMGDQWWDLDPFGIDHQAANPYYNTLTAFDRSNPAMEDLRLTSRLDGFAASDVIAAIDRAQNVFVNPNARVFVLDDDPNPLASGDQITELKDNVLLPAGQTVIHDNTHDAITTAGGPVLGYVSHGTNDRSGGLGIGYIQNQLQFELADGAVFHTHESFNAYSFQAGGDGGGQGLIAEWLAIGGTAGIGHVEEPYSGLFNVSNEDILFQMILDGHTYAEAAWNSLRQVSYVNTFAGDGLAMARQLMAGDANADGLVGSADLAVIGANWGLVGDPGGSLWPMGDFDGDGLVGSADLAVVGANWGGTADWYSGAASAESGFDPAVLGIPVSEPSLRFMVIVVLPCLAFLLWLRQVSVPKTAAV